MSTQKDPNETFNEFHARMMYRDKLLYDFYNSKLIQKKKWQYEKAYDSIFDKIINQLIVMAGGRSHVKAAIDAPWFIIGDAQFNTDNSLHSVFQDKLVKKLLGLGYVIKTVNESYTSCKCPRCHHQVEFKSMRIKYCRNCNIHYHRDVMAAENMVHIAISILRTGKRPDYLPKWSPKKQDNHHHHHPQDINQDIKGGRGAAKRKNVDPNDSNSNSNKRIAL
jgi:Zn finger protein HypA/HybF involved in hydrogenase expression